ncbi:Cytochrome P450 [Akanthomyces lecanii RCEF 1005]|uniref:Cytochrome P450 n=1 Tax=Akanthomyces lecanii RCEF 1005 TaxID=1081108 RepID=A0A162K7T1_CORDF|nr:Cytochrome P450 [Akanthomyces lecanii RCEF 1005]
MCGFHKWISFMQYDPTWRQHRKAIHQQMGTKKTAAQFNDAQDMETRRLLVRLTEDPKGLFQHIRSEAAAIILRVTYGYAINPHEPDPLMLLIDTMMDNFSKAFVPACWVVDSIPLLRFLPSWLPGMSFKTTAADWLRINHQANDVPYAFVQQQMQKGTHRPSYVSQQIEQSTRDGTLAMDRDVEDTIKWTASVMYGGGSDTTAAVISAFFQAMVMFPDVQAKAQREIDTVVGSSRLPELQDQDQLPYVSAVVKEALRWFPITPMGVSHVNEEEIEYAGFTIPKGSIIMPATWWFQNDPQVHANPSSFEPERFMAPRNEPDPAQTIFGHGRRVCPGRFLADMSLFLTLSRVLAVLDVRKAVDKSGQPIDAKLQFQPGMISRPAEFPFYIAVRSPSHARLVQDVASLLPKEAGDDTLLDLVTR